MGLFGMKSSAEVAIEYLRREIKEFKDDNSKLHDRSTQVMTDHIAKEDAWQEEMVKREADCPKTADIKELQRHNEEQNGKLGRVEKSVDLMVARQTWRKELHRAAVIVIPIVLTIFGLWLSITHAKKTKEAEREPIAIVRELE